MYTIFVIYNIHDTIFDYAQVQSLQDELEAVREDIERERFIDVHIMFTPFKESRFIPIYSCLYTSQIYSDNFTSAPTCMHIYVDAI